MTVDRNQFTKHFSVVLWEPGHLGAFLGRLLNDEHIANKLATCPYLSNAFEITPQLEWVWKERTSEVFSYDLSTYETQAKIFNSAEDELTLKIMKYGYLRSKDFFDGNSCDINLLNRHNIINYEKILPELNNIQIDTDISFSYVKSHLTALDRVNKFTWNKKIFCSFPQTKAWMGNFFVFYKHFYYYSLIENFDLRQTVSPNTTYFKIFGSNFLSDVETGFKNYTEVYKDTGRPFLNGWHYKNLKEPEYIFVDMYDLVFNKNYQQLEKITGDPVTEQQKILIDQMYSAQNSILAHFCLDHRYEHYVWNNGNYFINDKIKEIYNNLSSVLK